MSTQSNQPFSTAIKLLLWINGLLLFLGLVSMTKTLSLAGPGLSGLQVNVLFETIGFSLWYLLGTTMILSRSKKLFYAYILCALGYLVIHVIGVIAQLVLTSEDRELILKQQGIKMLASLVILWLITTTHNHFTNNGWQFWRLKKDDTHD